MKKKILFICGSHNQTTQMHKIACELSEYDNYFTPHYADGLVEFLRKVRLTEMTVVGNKLVKKCMAYLNSHQLKIDFRGKNNDYDLVVTCSDLVVQKVLLDKRVVMVQEGMIDPITWKFHLVTKLRFLPMWLAGTSIVGLSDQYEHFCVASEGFKQIFIERGVKPEKIRVTGIPNFDNCSDFERSDFPHKDFVLVCTSDLREKYRLENRKKFIQFARSVADGQQLIFKLHPNENHARATREINRWAPEALVYNHGSAEQMIAKCHTLITRYSSTIMVAAALDKRVISDFDDETIHKMKPWQNGNAAARIADLCRDMLNSQ
ncbi:MAG: hypothetical protein ACOY90_15565 [Candidatus Zhuqueibacterota bacterium]